MTAIAQLFAAGYLLSLSLCMDLGVVNIAMVRAGLTRGMPTALLLGFGSCVGDMIYAVCSLSLVTVLLANRGVRIALWIGGSAVLMWLAVKMLRETWHPKQLAITTPENAGALRSGHEFVRGMMLALSSPSAILWFAAVGGSVIAAHANAGAALAPFLFGFFFAGVCWTLLIATLTGYAHRRLSSRFIRGLSLASAILFCYFAVVVFVDGYREFV